MQDVTFDNTWIFEPSEQFKDAMRAKKAELVMEDKQEQAALVAEKAASKAAAKVLSDMMPPPVPTKRAAKAKPKPKAKGAQRLPLAAACRRSAAPLSWLPWRLWNRLGANHQVVVQSYLTP